MVSLCPGYVTYLFLTRSPLYVQSKSNVPFDLHVLATPPAFVLSQDQTLRFYSLNTRHLAAPRMFCELTDALGQSPNTSDSNARLQTRMFEVPPTGQVRLVRTRSTPTTDQYSDPIARADCFSVRGVLTGTARVLHILAAISVHLSKSIGRQSRPNHLAGLRAKRAPPRRAPYAITA